MNTKNSRPLDPSRAVAFTSPVPGPDPQDAYALGAFAYLTALRAEATAFGVVHATELRTPDGIHRLVTARMDADADADVDYRDGRTDLEMARDYYGWIQ